MTRITMGICISMYRNAANDRIDGRWVSIPSAIASQRPWELETLLFKTAKKAGGSG